MPGNRNAERETEVKILVRLAVARGIARIPENAGRTRVEQLVESLRSHAGEHGWSGGEEAEFDGAVAAHFATWPATVVQATLERDRTKILFWGARLRLRSNVEVSEVLRDPSFSIIKSRVTCYLGALQTMVFTT